MKCNCGKEAVNNDKFCRHCGEQLPEEEVFSCECGSEVLKNDKFCHECGAPFSSNSVCECGVELVENARFCHGCGKDLFKEPAQETEEASEKMPENTANYRQNPDGSYTFIKGKQPEDQSM